MKAFVEFTDGVSITIDTGFIECEARIEVKWPSDSLSFYVDKDELDQLIVILSAARKRMR